MAISRKPQAAAKSRDVVDINALIHKGGSVASEQVREGEELPRFCFVFLLTSSVVLTYP